VTTGPLPTPSLAGTTISVPVYSDLTAAATSWGDGKLGFGDITAVADLGLGILNTALDPVGAILGSGVDNLMNLLVNNIEFLKKAVDDLLGDPDSITTTAQSWSQAGVTIADSANRHVGYLSDTPSWTGPAADAYAGVVRGTHEVYLQASEAAADVSGWIGVAGSVVAAFRAFIWGHAQGLHHPGDRGGAAGAGVGDPVVRRLDRRVHRLVRRQDGDDGRQVRQDAVQADDQDRRPRKLGMSGRQFDVAAQQLRQVASRLGRRASGNFGRSGMTPNPRMPGETAPDFKRDVPGYDDFQKNVKRGTNVTNAVDQGAHNHQDGTSTPIDPLPAGY